MGVSGWGLQAHPACDVEQNGWIAEGGQLRSNDAAPVVISGDLLGEFGVIFCSTPGQEKKFTGYRLFSAAE